MTDSHDDEPIAGGPHGAADHGDAPGHEHDDHAHTSPGLGPVDWPAYGAGILGLAIGVGMAAVFAVAVGLA
jgi:hypothetical protein